MSGSFSLTHFSFEAVKFAGEFNSCAAHFSSPILVKALLKKQNIDVDAVEVAASH